MKKNDFVFAIFMSCVWVLLAAAREAGATQVHSDPEGLYVHQIAHIFFIFSMGILIYWLRGRNLVKEAGWRFVQYSAFFFILWNADAFFVHYLDERNDIIRMINAGSWHARIEFLKGHDELAALYYLGKLDHLLCVPAVIFLYAGLRQLLKQAKEVDPAEERPS